MFTRLFWRDTVERVVSTMAQALLALLLTDGFDLLTFDWKAGLSVVVTAGVISLLKAIVADKLSKNTISPASLAPDDKGVLH